MGGANVIWLCQMSKAESVLGPESVAAAGFLSSCVEKYACQIDGSFKAISFLLSLYLCQN
jgi:hypothetical protein